MKVLFLGSSRFSLIVLKKMLEERVNIIGVITQPDKPSGRGHKLTPSEVKVYALENGIKVYDFDKVRNHIAEIKEIDYDVAVVASFGQILPQEFLDIHLTINVHPSLLPKYRGATPIQSALLNCDKETGVTIMKVAKAVDSGDILLQERVEIGDEYYLALEDKLAQIGGTMACQALKLIENNRCEWHEQDHEKATIVSKLTKEDGVLDFATSSNQILGKVRAMSEEIGAFVLLNGNFLKVGEAKHAQLNNEENDLLKKGEILNNKKKFVVGCADGGIEILKVQAPSGKMISGRDYINGHNDILGKKVDNV